MMPWEDVLVQLIDTPPITADHFDANVLGLVRGADLALLMVDLGSDDHNCGSCRSVCSAQHIASPTCAGGACNGQCDPGWGDCNNNKLSDGCETGLRTQANCGSCGNVRPVEYHCRGGECQQPESCYDCGY